MACFKKLAHNLEHLIISQRKLMQFQLLAAHKCHYVPFGKKWGAELVSLLPNWSPCYLYLDKNLWIISLHRHLLQTPALESVSVSAISLSYTI